MDCQNLGLESPGGTQQLHPQQRDALRAAAANGGVFGDIPVGGGKTHITALLPHMFPECRRYALILPASLVRKTYHEFDAIFDHWRFPAGVTYRLFSYSELGLKNRATALEDYAPDLVAADEAHRLKEGTAGVTRRVVRYKTDHPEVPFCLLSGTLFGGPWEPLARLLWLAFGVASPLPSKASVVRQWDFLFESFTPFWPAELRRFGQDAEDIRVGLTAHCRAHPGVVSVDTDRGRATLKLFRKKPAKVPIIEEALARLYQTNLVPGSDEVECTDSDKARHTNTLLWGWYSVWDPHPPESWLYARGEWLRFAKHTIVGSSFYDTEGQLADACVSGSIPDGDRYANWLVEQELFKENRKPVWLTDEVIEQLPEPCSRTLYWVRFRELGRKVAKRFGIPFFHRGDKDGIEEHSGPMVLSIASHREGRNLQFKWSTSHVLTPPGDVSVWEQLIGRTQRPGQTEDVVRVYAWLGHPSIQKRFHALLTEAKIRSRMRDSANLLTLAEKQW